ncbi:YbaB/EbfC family nucleoid-associated protein [Streptoalloteichus hindustanus]|uniref:YbaB/EbfC DNA-binding family protein n=1 Tax=Streptoalloteichus hindustanus TaxID=2017 RepID=A0A1M5KAN9_STRHI|nr:YbaB/EbfC family nucleoid-associated protein [Streptoalloteichus hindustanus]SHG49798.1 YbaB/EbfC DNA-binding family protein [Streptoalloteichus hindustanus]
MNTADTGIGPDIESDTDELVEQAEQRQHASEHLERALDSMTGTARSADGMVVAVASARGELRKLDLHPAAPRMGSQALGEAIAATAQQAVRVAVQRCFNVLAPALGDELTTTVEQLVGIAPARADGWDAASEIRAPMVAGVGKPRPAGQAGGPGVGGAGVGAAPANADTGADSDVDEDDIFSFDPASLRSDR